MLLQKYGNYKRGLPDIVARNISMQRPDRVRSCLREPSRPSGVGSAVATLESDRFITPEQSRADEAPYQLLFQANPSPMWVCDAQTLHFLAVNDAAIAQYGYSREEFLSLAERDIEQRGGWEENLAHAPPHSQGKARHVKKDGSVITVAVSTAPILFNNAAARITTAIDMTDQERAEIELRQSEANLARAQRLSHIGSWEIDLGGRGEREKNPPRWSDETFRIFGLEPGEIQVTRKSFFNLLHPVDRKLARAALVRQMRTGTPYSMEHRIVRPDGAERVVQVKSEAVRAANGQVVRIAGTIRDVTDTKEAERLLREQAELLNLAQDAILVAEIGGLIRFWNKAAERIYGWSVHEALGKSVEEVFHDAKVLEAATATTLAEGAWTGEVEHERKDGTTVRVTSRWTLVHDEAGKAKSFLIISTDVTEQKRCEQQILRAQRLESIGTLASGVAHDLNNILAPIVMATPLLRMEMTPDARAKLLNVVEASAQRGTAVVKQILTFARGASGERALIQPLHLVKEIARIAVETFPRNIVIRALYPKELAPLKGDPSQLHQVLLNLCINARDAMPNGGELTISAENFEIDDHYAGMTAGATAGPHVMLRVSDTGTGIPRYIIDKIFDPFFTTKEVGKGTGLGLSTAIGIVKSHGGFLNVYSESGGTTFKVFIPAAAHGEASSTPKSPAVIPYGKGETILVVDDEPGLRHVAEAVLIEHGYKVILAGDGIEGLSVFVKGAADIRLVVTDVAMPFLDGLTLARTVRKMQPAAKVIISTGRDEDCRGAGLNALDVDEVLTKPYTRETLLLAVDRVLNSRMTVAA